MAIIIGLCALVTGCAVLLVGAMLPDLQPLPLNESTTAVNRAAAREFYAAQDDALSTGDVRRLIAAVAPAFVDHRPGLAAGQDRTGLVGEITALRSVRPGVRLTTEALLVDGDRVLVYVSLFPTDPAGQTAASPNAASADTIEVVRVAGGLVAERWSLQGVPGTWPPTIVTPTAVPPWSSSRFATATAAGQVCGASHCS